MEKNNVNEIAKLFIENNNDVEKDFNLKDKKDIFLLSLAFASKKKILKVDLDSLNLEELQSFDKMLYTWWKEELRPDFEETNTENYAFLICPYRHALEEAKKIAQIFVSNVEKAGYKAYYPARDTEQEDYYSYKVGLDNANAISNARNIFLYYDRNSIGSVFDLGVAYYFQMKYPERTITVINGNKIDWNRNDFGDEIVLSMLDMQQEYNKKNNNTRIRK